MRRVKPSFTANKDLSNPNLRNLGFYFVVQKKMQSKESSNIACHQLRDNTELFPYLTTKQRA